MPPFDLLIINAWLCTASDKTHCDIGVREEKIAFLGYASEQEKKEAGRVIDAEGAHVMPGGIDAHVHICQDSGKARCADDFETGSRSAIAGGTTTFIPFALQLREDESLLKVVEDYHAKANATGSYIDYGFHVIITNPNPAVIKELPILMEQGVTSCKIFMTYDEMKLRDNQLLDVMLAAKACGMTTMMHAENGDIINWLTSQLESRSLTSPYYHALSRPPIVESEAVNRAIVLSTLVDNPILFVHVSGVEATDVIRKARAEGKSVAGETCPQYLYLTWEDLKRHHHPHTFTNSQLICSPPPGPTASSQSSLWKALNDGTMTIFSSDHCPYVFEGKDGKVLGVTEGEVFEGKKEDVKEFVKGKDGQFKYIPNGCPGVETRLPLLYKGMMEGKISTETFVAVTSTNVAKLYGLYPQKGSLLPGSDADLTIFYPPSSLKPFKLSWQDLHTAVDYTPYEGIEFGNWVRWTICRGRVAWDRDMELSTKQGVLQSGLEQGRYIKRGVGEMVGQRARARETIGFAERGDVSQVATWL